MSDPANGPARPADGSWWQWSVRAGNVLVEVPPLDPDEVAEVAALFELIHTTLKRRAAARPEDTDR